MSEENLSRLVAERDIAQREEMMATIANLYYKLNQSQHQIAARLDISPSTVSRLLKEAHERGIVEIRIQMPVPRNFVIEQELIDRFGLKDALVLQTSGVLDHATLIQAVGRLASIYVARFISRLPQGISIGVAWGESVHATVTALPDNLSQNNNVVQLVGDVDAYGIDSAELARVVALKLGGRHYRLHAPALMEQPEVRDMLLQEPTIRDLLARATSIQLAITGIGTLLEGSSFLRAGLLSRENLRQLQAQGIVGEICGSFYDKEGKHADYEINRRVVALSLNELQAIPRVLAVARGANKIDSILGALQGHLLTVLATDDLTAQAILQRAAP